MRKIGFKSPSQICKPLGINLENSKVQKKLHQIKKEKTRTVTYRLPEKIVQTLES